MCPPNLLATCDPQGRIHDLTVNNFKSFQRDLSLGHLCGEPTVFHENVPSLLEFPSTSVATRTVRAPDKADVEAPEPQDLERPYRPPQDVQFSYDSDYSFIPLKLFMPMLFYTLKRYATLLLT